jgi:hypothetical protein
MNVMLVSTKGGTKALRNNDEVLLSLEETAGKAASVSSEGHRMPRTKPGDASTNADDLKKEINEDLDSAVDKNRIVFFPKFEVQKRQIIDELLVVTRESDRVIQVVKGGPHERILDRVSILSPRLLTEREMITSWSLQSIHEIWTEMAAIMTLLIAFWTLMTPVGLAREGESPTLCARFSRLLPREAHPRSPRR